jgi:hypothetical protein
VRVSVRVKARLMVYLGVRVRVVANVWLY